MPCPMYSTDKEDKIEGSANAVPFLRVKAKARRNYVTDLLCKELVYSFMIKVDNHKIVDMEHGRWVFSLCTHWCACMHCSSGGSDSSCGLCINTKGKFNSFYSQLLCRLFSKEAIWLSSFCNVFLKVH